MEKNFTFNYKHLLLLNRKVAFLVFLALLVSTQTSAISFAGTGKWLSQLLTSPVDADKSAENGIAVCAPAGNAFLAGSSYTEIFAPLLPVNDIGEAATAISWSTAAARQPYPVSEAQGEVVNGKLYTFGGFDSQKSGFTPTSRAYVYNPVANTWAAIAPMPPMNGTGHGGVTHAGFATDGQDIYFAGGYTSNAAGTGQIFGTKEAWKYDVSANRYERLPDLPIALAAGQMEYLNGKLYHIGGTNAARTQDLGNHYVLDLNNISAGWKTLAPLPNPRQHAGSAVLDGKIYYIGGQNGHDSKLVTQKYVHSYSPATNSWTRVADLPVPPGANGRGHISSAVVVLNNRILVLAGETVFNTGFTNMVSAYSPATNTWENLTPMPQVRYSGVAAVLNGDLYYTGGSRSNITFKGLVSENERPSGLISGISATSSRSYTLAQLAVGTAIYTDRTYKVTSVPEILAGAAMVRTPNDDKTNTSTSLLSFNLNQPSTVFIAYDPRAEATPGWLAGWQKRTDRIGIEDSKISYLEIYSKSFAAGSVTLGGNLASPARGAQSNYMVFARAASTGPVFSDVKVNFQTSSTAAPAGYVADNGLAFNNDRGYGWVDPATKQPVNLTANMRLRTGTDELRLRTFAQMQANTNGQVPGTWEYVVPSGRYNVSVSVGDPAYFDSRHQVNVEGVTAVAGFVPSAQQKYSTATVEVEVTDGKLTIDAAGGANTKLSYALISQATTGTDNVPPVVSVDISGQMQETDVYGNEALINIQATDAGGSGLAGVQYSLNNEPYVTYTSPVRVTEAGEYTIRARAKDGNNNETVTAIHSFSVVAVAKSNTYMVLENMDKFALNDQLTFSKIHIPWRRPNQDGTYTPYNANHDKVRLRINNKGTGTLRIHSLALSSSAHWKISKLNGEAYTSAALPVVIGSKAYAELEVEFIAGNQATRVKLLDGVLRISSNDDQAPEKDVKLIGLWQSQGEGRFEPYAQEIIDAFGFKTKVGFAAHDGTSDGRTIIPNSDEIETPYFVRADQSMPVRVVQMAAYHGCCASTEVIQWHDKGSTAKQTIFVHDPLDGQSLLPRKRGSATAVAEGTFSPTGAFGLISSRSYTDRALNFEGRIGFRIWKAVDANGNIIPNAYIMGMDYLGTTYTNYDYQDNIYFVSNVKPETGPAYYSELGASPSDVSFSTLAVGGSQTKTVPVKNLGKNYAGGSDPAIQIKGIELAGPNAGDFTVGAPGNSNLGVQATTNISVSFSPKSRGIKNAVLLVHYNSAASPLRVPLYGIANDGNAAISVVRRIKGAAGANITISGNVWEADVNYRKGSVKLDKQIVAGPIAATDDDVLYQTYLSAGANLAETRYDIPVANGSYLVRMHLVENFFSADGARVFNVTAENLLKLSNVDIHAEAGYRTALVKDIAVNVSDGVLNLKFNPTENRLAIAGVELFKVSPTGAVASGATASALQSRPGSEAGLSLYPNPSRGDRLNVVLDNFGEQEKVMIQLFDLSGRLLQSFEAYTNAQGMYHAEILLKKHIGRGVYILKASALSGEKRAKLIIE